MEDSWDAHPPEAPLVQGETGTSDVSPPCEAHKEEIKSGSFTHCKAIASFVPLGQGTSGGATTEASYTTSANFLPAVGKLPTRAPATSSASVR